VDIPAEYTVEIVVKIDGIDEPFVGEQSSFKAAHPNMSRELCSRKTNNNTSFDRDPCSFRDYAHGRWDKSGVTLEL